MTHDIVTTIKSTKPSDCLLGCCYPLTQEEFYAAYNVSKDFISSQLGNYSSMTKEALWLDVYSLFAKTINDCLKYVENLGVKVIRNFTFQKLTLIDNYQVFTLCAHFSKTTGSIEFFDGMYTKEEFSDALNIKFKGLFDLTVCNSTLIRNVVKKRFSDGQVISFNISLPIIALMLVYKQVILNLSKTEINYINCYLKTIEHLNRKEMKNLQSILEEYRSRFINNLRAGDETNQENKKEFITTIQVVSRQNRMFLWINIGMLLIVFIGSILLVIYYRDDLNKVATISGFSGLSLAGMIYYMTNLWRQIVGIELAIAMADRMDAGSMPAIINSLLSTIKKEEK